MLPLGHLSQRFQRNFTESVRRRGELHYATGGLEVTDVSAEEFRGKVGGAETFAPALHLAYANDGADLSMSCTCPGFAASPCLHLWALLLAADDRGWGHALIEPPEADDDEDEPQRAVWATRSKGQLPSRTPPPDWRTLLANLDVTTGAEINRRGAREAESDREVWLVVNTGESLAQQHLQLDCMDRRLKANGEWGLFRPASCTIYDLASSQPADLLRTLQSAALPGRRISGDGRFESLTLNAYMHRLWWKSLMAEVKVGIASQTLAGKQILPATLDELSLWTDEIKVDRAKNGRDWLISLAIERDDGASVRLDEPLVVFPSGLVVFQDSLAWMRPRTAAEFQWVSLLRKNPRMAVPDAQLDQLMAKLLKLETTPRIRWSDEAVREGRAWTEESAAPQPILRLNRNALTTKKGTFVALTVAFTYGSHKVEGDDAREVLALDRERHILRRDLKAERALVDRLIDLGNREVATTVGGSLVTAAEALIGVVAAAEKDGWQIELDRVRVVSVTRTALSVRTGIDWFDLDGDVDFAGQQLGLPALLAALDERSPFVRLGDGSLGMLPSAMVERLAALADFGRVEGEGLRFDKMQIAVLCMLLAELPEVDTDELFATMRAKMQRFAGIAPVEPPAAFRGELRPYQREGLAWLGFLRDFGFGGCLADDMGLGKTIQVLAALPEAAAKAGPSLVVVPRSLVHNWRAEAARFRPDLRVLVYDDCDRKAAEAVIPNFDLVVMTYGCLRRDITRLRKVGFHYGILDEAQTIKNRASQTARAVRVLRAEHRLALSGTPVENRVEELLSLFDFLIPGMITTNTFKKVRARHTSEHALHDLLGRALRPFVLRRTKEQVLRDLPAKTEQTLYCDLEPDQRERYDQLRQYYQSHLMEKIGEDGFENAKFHVLEALLRLRQAACHPGLLDDTRLADPSAKLDALVEQLVDVVESGHKALVFSQFTSLLAIVRARLDKEGIASEYLDGQTRDREQRVARFQTDAAVPVFLVSLKAGGVGLNLTAAEYCFILDPWWNPAAEAQAIARAHRIGQTKPVFAYRLIARGTVEEKILELQASKRGIADAIVNADNASLGRMSLDDLRYLMS